MSHNVAGFLVEEECERLESFLDYKKDEIAIIIGGAKVSDKIKLLKNLIDKSDCILLGGAMVNTILYYYENIDNPDALENLIEKGDNIKILVDEIFNLAKSKNTTIEFPIDFITNENRKLDKENVFWELKKDEKIFDVGNKTIDHFEKILKTKKFIFWNGPLGKSDEELFAQGTINLLKKLDNLDMKILIGGGDTAAVATNLKIKGNIEICTGGGAAIEMLEGNLLPGIACLDNK